MTPLFKVAVPSIYKVNNAPAPLPPRMALATADMKAAIAAASQALAAKGGALVLSDMFRSYDMQLQAHLDFVNGRKTANSPPPGGSFHEAGRAFDLDIKQLKISLKDFWALAAPLGLAPIISQPDPTLDEAWHFEHRGSHQRVYDYYKAGRGTNFKAPYTAAAASAIVAIGVQVDAFGDGQKIAYLQSALIRLGDVIGNLDGQMGPKSRDALTARGLDPTDLDKAMTGVDDALQRAFPEEFFDRTDPIVPLVRA